MIVVLCALLCSLACVDAYISPFIDTDEATAGESRCVGLQAAFAKLENIQTADLERIQNPSGNRMFDVTSTSRITRADNGIVLMDRVRLHESIEGIKIKGSSVVVNFKGCNSFICAREVDSLTGKTFGEIDVPQGYTSNITQEEVRNNIIQVFGASEESIGELSLEVFAATDADHLAFFTDVLIAKDDYMKYFSVVIDAHSLDLLSICNLVGPISNDIERSQNVVASGKGKGKGKGPGSRRYLRKDPPVSVNGISCGSCVPDTKYVTWSSTHSSCPINSLYLNDTGRTTTCLVGTSSAGETVYGAGPVPELHWDGTEDCQSTSDQCQTTILPECSDAISDVQFGALKTLEYFQEYLGVMGGLSGNGDDPVPIKAKVHYRQQYCNAFYRYSANTVFFGDCDCSFWTPLTSIDIIAHEVSRVIDACLCLLLWVCIGKSSLTLLPIKRSLME